MVLLESKVSDALRVLTSKLKTVWIWVVFQIFMYRDDVCHWSESSHRVLVEIGRVMGSEACRGRVEFETRIESVSPLYSTSLRETGVS